MSDPHEPGRDALDEGELLAAYLDADTDEVTTARVERRLQTDRRFAARLDAVAATRARLQRLDEVATPAAARAGLDARLAAERGAASQDPVRQASPARERRWRNLNLAPLAAAAVLVLVAVVGVGSLFTGSVGGGAGSEESGAVTQAAGDARSEAAVAEDPRPAPANEAAGGAGGAGGLETDERPADRRELSAPAPRVGGDAEIRARALELLDEPVEDLAARERRLRRAAGLPVERLCVDGLDASTVDVVDADGRVVVAVLLPGGDLMQVALLDPKSCAPIRTIPASR